jgi:hypothetical protein
VAGDPGVSGAAPRCEAFADRPPRASAATSSIGAPILAVTAAATAPSTNGASVSTTFARISSGSRSSAISVDRIALPRSMSTRTPSSDHARSIACCTRTASVPIPWSGPSSPPAVSIRTSSPPIWRASSAVPSASSKLCETRTMPIIAPRSPAPAAPS